MKYGTGTTQTYLPLHTLVMNLGEMKSKLVMKIHVISGCDLTSKICTKLAVLNKNPEQYLQLFGENEADQELAFKLAEKYLIEIISTSSNCSSFNELRYRMYTAKGKALNELPPTSLEIQVHLYPSYGDLILHTWFVEGGVHPPEISAATCCMKL